MIRTMVYSLHVVIGELGYVLVCVFGFRITCIALSFQNAASADSSRSEAFSICLRAAAEAALASRFMIDLINRLMFNARLLCQCYKRQVPYALVRREHACPLAAACVRVAPW